MKTIDQCLEEATEKFARKVGGSNVECLYPILKKIVYEGFEAFLKEYKETHEWEMKEKEPSEVIDDIIAHITAQMIKEGLTW